MEMRRPANGIKTKIIGAILVLLALVSMVDDTYMLRDNRQNEINAARGELLTPAVQLEGDFGKISGWRTSDPELTQEIRVTYLRKESEEFSGVYVRLQLKEYMEINPLTYTQTAERYMIDNNGKFVVYNDDGNDTGNPATDAGHTKALHDWPGHTVTWLKDAATSDEGWFVQTRAHDLNGQYGKFVVTDISLAASATPLVPGAVRADDEAGSLYHVKPNGECDYEIYRWNGEPDGSNYDGTEMFPGHTDAGNLTFRDFVAWNQGADVISLSAWDGEPVAKWIYDDRASEGGGTNWVYWGQLLEPQNETENNPDSMTSNLLENIRLLLQPQGEFYYAIHVEMETLSPDELVDGANWTDAPQQIIASHINNASFIRLTQIRNSIEVNETAEQEALVTVFKTPETVAVTWNSNEPAVATVNATTGEVTGIETGTVTITATLPTGEKASYMLDVVSAYIP
jgi:hypothetical protein